MKFFWISVFIVALIIFVWMDSNPIQAGQISEDYILPIFLGGLIVFWILDKLFNILPKKAQRIIDKKINKKKASNKLSKSQHLINFLLAVFACFILLGLITSGFNP